MGGGYYETFHCDKLKFVAAYGAESGVYLLERFCWGSGGVGGENVEDAEEAFVEFSIVAEFEVRFCSERDVGVVVGVRGRVYAFLVLSMIQRLDVPLDGIGV